MSVVPERLTIFLYAVSEVYSSGNKYMYKDKSSFWVDDGNILTR